MWKRVALVSFPALDAFAADRSVRRLTFRLYMYLQREVLDLTSPRLVKNAIIAEKLSMRPASVISALNWLVTAGYLVEHPRGPRGDRSFTLAWSVQPQHRRVS